MTPRPLSQLFDAMYHGKHHFDDFLNMDVEKNFTSVQWKTRTIYKPSPLLKKFHSFLNGFLLDHLPVNAQVSFAYRKGATLYQAVLPHSKSRAFYQTDLEKFFNSITEPLIRSTIQRATIPIEDISSYLDRIICMLTIEGRLPIGYSTSPTLSNACLLHFDEAMAIESEARGWLYTRYADDIIISSSDRANVSNAPSVIRECLARTLEGDFRLNESKSKLTTVGRKIKLLGLVILPTGIICIDRELRHRLESRLHFYVTNRTLLEKIFEEEHSGEGMEKGLQRLSGLISYASDADPNYLEKLRAKFGTTVVDSLLHRSAK